MEREIELKQDVKIKDKVWRAGRYKIPKDMASTLADWLLKTLPNIAELVSAVPPKPGPQALPETEPELEPKADPIDYMKQAMDEAQKFKAERPASQKTIEEAKEKPAPKIDPELTSWLDEHGWARGPSGYWKQDRLAGDIVKLQIDFDKDSRGLRFGYILDFSTDPPKWKSRDDVRNHQDLIAFKEYRDWLFDQRKEVREKGKAGTRKEGNKGTREIPAGQGQALLIETEKEKMDDAQILAELSGDFASDVLKQFFYSFISKGRKITGLSYKGVKQIILRKGKVEIVEKEWKETEKAHVWIIKVRDKEKDLEALGAECVTKDTPFAFKLALAKALRNAYRFLIPETVITEAYKRWEQGREV